MSVIRKPIKFGNTKKYYFNVLGPLKSHLILAETSFEAMAIAIEKDGFRFLTNDYKATKTK